MQGNAQDGAKGAEAMAQENVRQSREGFSMCELDLAAAGDSMVSSEKAVAEYLLRAGLKPEPGIANMDRAKRIQAHRRKNYRNVDSLLEQYRSLRRTYTVFKQEFAERLSGETHILDNVQVGQDTLFNKLSEDLQLLAVADERKFKAVYAPQIAAGRRIEIAITALDFGMKVLKAEDEVGWALIKAAYIDGESKPPVRELVATFDFTGISTYYSKMDAAKRRLTTAIFGYANNKAELASILVYLRQQADDDYFPDEL